MRRVVLIAAVNLAACSADEHQVTPPNLLGDRSSDDGDFADPADPAEPVDPADPGSPAKPPCCAADLAARVTMRNVPVGRSIATASATPYGQEQAVYTAPLADGRTVLAFHDGAAATVVVLMDESLSSPIEVACDELRAFAVIDAAGAFAALLIARAPQMVLVVVDTDGNVLHELATVGTDDPIVEGSRWIDSWGYDGAIAARRTGSGYEIAAYHGQTGNFGALGNHQGDRFEIVNQDGERTTMWDWGCSHSTDVRLADNGTSWAPICRSDCYPHKGIQRNFGFGGGALLVADPDANCVGSNVVALGGIAALADGFAVSFASPHERDSFDIGIAFLNNDGSPTPPVFLTDDEIAQGAPHLAPYGTRLLLAGWQSGSDHLLATLDAAGSIVEGPAVVGAHFRPVEDFVAAEIDGDVVWGSIGADGSSIDLFRVCAL